MSKNLRKLAVMLCAILLCIGSFAGFALADDEGAYADAAPVVLVPHNTVELSNSEYPASESTSFVTLAASLAAVEFASQAEEEEAIINVPASAPAGPGDDVTVVEYTEIPVYVNGTDAGTAMKIGDSTYVPVGDFFEAIGVEYTSTWDQDSGTAVFTGGGVELSATAGERYFTANDRCFYTGEDIYNINGTIVLPVREMALCFGLDVQWDETDWTVGISGTPAALVPGSEYYDEEDLYWLSRIIFAESGNQSIEGMIAVGNVVLNRVEDPTCPDTVYDVIFDDEYGVQFSVTETGAIFLEPSEKAVIAAKIGLEGYNLVGDSLFFVNPDIGVSSWFVNTRTFVASIGDHDFYA